MRIFLIKLSILFDFFTYCQLYTVKYSYRSKCTRIEWFLVRFEQKKSSKRFNSKKTCIYIWNRLSRAFGSLLSTTHFSRWKSVRLLSFETMTVFFVRNSKEKQLTHYGITEILFTLFWICIKHSSQCIIWEIQSVWA